MDNDEVTASQPLRQAHERAIGVTVPLPISKRLDLLIERAEESGIRIYRKDLVAALILAAPEAPEALRDLFLSYRQATAADAGLRGSPEATVLKLERQKPGRRPRTG